ncbi:MAG: PAS domain-containing protein [Planctomycetes bacterium]|nr:PAS domain-containing protein [Planctomycetota bacterium]
MPTNDDEDRQLRSAALQNANVVLLARQRAERELAAERELLRVTLASIGDAVISTDADGRVRFLNGVAATLTGWSQAEAGGTPLDQVFRIVNETTREPVENPALRALAEGAIVGLANHTILISRDGTERPIQDSAAPIRDVTGAIVGAVLVFRDITEHRRAERELQSSEEFLRRLVASSQDCIKVLDLDGRVQSINACGMRMLEIDDFGRVAGECWTGFWHDAEQSVADRAVAEARTGRSSEFVGFCQTFAGRPRWWDVVVTPIAGAGGATEKILVVSRDVTERKQAEEAVRFLADASASLAELVDYDTTLQRIANLAVAGFADWCVVDILDAAGNRRRLAVTHPEAAGVSIPRSTDAAGVPHVLRTGEPELVPDVLELDPATALEGAERIALLRAWGVRSYMAVPLSSRGRVIGGMTFLSISVRRQYGPEHLRVAQELARRVTTAIENASLYRELQEQDRRKDEFLATLAHELRNPLAPVRNGVQILHAMKLADVRAARTLGMMERQLEHMVHMIDDLMDVARVSSGKVVLRKEWVDLKSVVTIAVEASRQVIEKGGHEFTLRLPPEPLVLEVDRVRLSQVLSNLLNNAAKYTPHGGRVELIAERDGRDAVIRVLDTGVGVPPEMLPKIFEMFTQVGSSLDRAQGGLGIGLTLVKRLVELHGGTVTAKKRRSGEGERIRRSVAAGLRTLR